MILIRRAILALALMAGLVPAFAQAPPPVPGLPDTERRTSYSITGATCACAVNFALYGDSTDYQDWVEVYLNGVRVNYNDATFGWTITSPTGSLATIPRPITDAVLTFNSVQTGTVQIVGARRPRRVSQFSENRGVAARDLNQALTDVVAQNRETWDKINDVTGRALISQPGNTVGLLPLPSACGGKYLGFDATGLIPQCLGGGPGSGNVTGPGSSTSGNLPAFSNSGGNLLADSGIPSSIGNNQLMSNISGSTGAYSGHTPTSIWDSVCSSTVGQFWVRLSSAWGCTSLGYANPVWWGADPTGASDSASAFNSAIATGLPIRWPPGTFKINSAISVTLANGAAAFRMDGAGSNSTILNWPNASGGLTINGANVKNSFHLHDFAVTTSQVGSGVGIHVIAGAYFGGNAPPSDIINVTARGDDLNGITASSHYWQTAVYVHNWSGVDAFNLNTWGAFNPTPGSAGGGNGLVIEGDAPSTNYATLINVIGSSFNAHAIGVELGSYWQGLTFKECNFNGAVGSDALLEIGSAAGTLSLLNIESSQFNYAGTQISLNSPVLVLQLIGNAISVYGNSGVGVTIPSGSVYAQITGNFFNTFGSPTGTFAIATQGSNGTIVGNGFSGVTTGVNLQGSSSNYTVGLNAYHSSVTTKVTNSGTGNSVGTAAAGSMTGVVP